MRGIGRLEEALGAVEVELAVAHFNRDEELVVRGRFSAVVVVAQTTVGAERAEHNDVIGRLMAIFGWSSSGKRSLFADVAVAGLLCGVCCTRSASCIRSTKSRRKYGETAGSRCG